MAVSARHAEIHERAKERVWKPTTDRVQLLTELSLLRDEVPEWDRLMEHSAEAIAEHYDAGCTLSLLTDETLMHRIGSHHPDPGARAQLEELVGRPVPLLPQLEGQVVETGNPRLVSLQPEDLEGRPEARRYLELSGARNAAIVPLRARKRVMGLLWLSTDRSLEEDDLRFLEEIAGRIGLLVDLSRLASGDLPPDVRPPTAGPAAVLTERERDVLGLIATGMTSREVADRLVLSVRTVEWHRGRIQAKMGVSGRAALTRIANEAGIVPDVQ